MRRGESVLRELLGQVFLKCERARMEITYTVYMAALSDMVFR